MDVLERILARLEKEEEKHNMAADRAFDDRSGRAARELRTMAFTFNAARSIVREEMAKEGINEEHPTKQ